MLLEPIVSALRVRCPSFAGRIAGAAQFKLLQESAAMPVPCAFIIPLDDNPQPSASQNSVRQPLTESFSIIVAINNVADEKGQGAVQSIDPVRAELWAALLGWQPTSRHDGIAYEGGSLLSLDRARLWYQFDFGADMEIEPADGWQETELAALPHFDGANISLDARDPADPNLASPGPDGRVEVAFSSPQDPNENLP